VSQKNFTTLSCCNFNTHQSILIIFGRNVTEKVNNKKMLNYPTSQN